MLLPVLASRALVWAELIELTIKAKVGLDLLAFNVVGF